MPKDSRQGTPGYNPVSPAANLFGAAFDRAAAGAGIEVLRIPYHAPKANATVERFIGSVRRECLDHFLLFTEKHLTHLVKTYGSYFNQDRPHQGIEQRVPDRPIPSLSDLLSLYSDFTRSLSMTIFKIRSKKVFGKGQTPNPNPSPASEGRVPTAQESPAL